MRSIMIKEMKLSASVLAYLFIAFGLVFFLPGYPVLCGEFFVTLGIYQSFMYAREAKDIVFSALLPVAKSDVVKGKFAFSCMIELCAFVIMFLAVLLRMTMLKGSQVYVNNALMNANFFALGTALLLFGIFNMLFLEGFFKTAYNTGRPFVRYIIVCFVIIGIAEAMHHFPGLDWVNAFGTEYMGRQVLCLAAGASCYGGLTAKAYRKSCKSFENIDL